MELYRRPNERFHNFLTFGMDAIRVGTMTIAGELELDLTPVQVQEWNRNQVQ